MFSLFVKFGMFVNWQSLTNSARLVKYEIVLIPYSLYSVVSDGTSSPLERAATNENRKLCRKYYNYKAENLY